MSGRFEEAVETAKDSVELESVDPSPYLYLAAACVAIDRMDEAKRTARDVLKKDPDFTLKGFAQTQPYKNAQTLDLLLSRLNRAGFS